MKLNFKEFSLPMGVSGKRRRIGDARESFADIVYLKTTGIRSHSLAMKIYESEGEEEYSDQEVQLMREVAERWCAPNFIDGLLEQINNQKQ